jgi:hypothetical protein
MESLQRDVYLAMRGHELCFVMLFEIDILFEIDMCFVLINVRLAFATSLFI